MKSTPMILAVLLFLCAGVLPGCEDLEAEVRVTFDDYIEARINKDISTALDLIDPRYFQHLDFIAKMARTGEKEKVLRMRPAERLQLVMMRSRLPRKELAALTGREWMQRMIAEGWSFDGVLGELDVGEITIRKPRAFANMELDGLRTNFTMEFVKTEGKWVLDPTAIEELINELLTKRFQGPEGIDVFIQRWESTRGGKPVTHTIWDTPKK